MSEKLLGKVIAGAALVGSALLMTPAPAPADEAPPPPDGQHRWDDDHRYGDHHDGYVLTNPRHVKPGHWVTIYEVCSRPQRAPWVWSKVTGKLVLRPFPRHKRPAAPSTPPTPQPTQPTAQPTAPPSPPTQPPGQPTAEPSPTIEPSPTDQVPGQPTTEPSPTDQVPGSPTPQPTLSEPGFPGEPGTPNEPGSPAEPGSPDEQALAGAIAMVPADGTGAGFAETAAHDRTKTHRWVYGTRFRVPHHTSPGHYVLKGSCGRGELIVIPVGAVRGGDGGSHSSSPTVLAASGTGVLAAASIGGLLLLRRRRRLDSMA